MRSVQPEGVTLRPGRDGDSEAVTALIGRVFDEYPGCVLDVDGEMPELRAIATAFRDAGGAFWVAELGGAVVGCVGLVPAQGAAVELRKLYVDRSARRRGLGGALCALVEREAASRGAVRVELWSDTRFADAHRLYESRGYERVALPLGARALGDKSGTVEYAFSRPSLSIPRERDDS